MESVKKLLQPLLMTQTYSERSGPQEYTLTKSFYDGSGPVTNVDGAEYIILYDPAQTTPSPLNHAGAEARILQPKGLKDRRAALFHNYNSIALNADVLDAIREPGSLGLQDRGRTELIRQQTSFKTRQDLLKELVIAKSLVDGIVYVNYKGEVLESSTGAEYSASMEVAAAHQGNCGGIIGAYWSVASTDIAKQIDDLKQQGEVDDAEVISEVWCNPIVKSYLRKNTDFQTWASQNSGGDAAAILRGETIQGLWGLNWNFYGRTYTDVTGAKKPFIPANKVFFCPAPNSGWLQASAGSSLLPKNFGLAQSLEEALANLVKVYGDFSYAALAGNPTRLEMFMGGKFGLHFVNPNSIFQAQIAA